jgi:hypothetical protein
MPASGSKVFFTNPISFNYLSFLNICSINPAGDISNFRFGKCALLPVIKYYALPVIANFKNISCFSSSFANGTT